MNTIERMSFFHRVQANERLSSIAALHGVGVADIIAANPQKPLARLQSGVVVFASLSAGEDIALPAMLGTVTQEVEDLCAGHGGIAQYMEKEDPAGDTYTFALACVDGKKCSGGTAGSPQCQDPQVGSACTAGGVPGTLVDTSMMPGKQTLVCKPGTANPGDPCTNVFGQAGTYDAAMSCIPPLQVYPGQACLTSDAYAGTYDANLNCVLQQQSAYPGDSCTTPDGKAGEYDSYLNCVAYPPSQENRRFGGLKIDPGLFLLPPPPPPKQRTPPPPPPPPPPPQRRAGDACDLNGKPGHLNQNLICVQNASPPRPGDPCKAGGEMGRYNAAGKCIVEQRSGEGEAAPAAASSIWPWVAGGVAVLLAAGGAYAYQEKKGPFAPKK